MNDDARHILHLFGKLRTALREANAESRLAYAFNANSYTFGSMNRCLAAAEALEDLGEALGDLIGDEQHEQTGEERDVA